MEFEGAMCVWTFAAAVQGKGVITGEEREGKKEREDGEESGEWEMGN